MKILMVTSESVPFSKSGGLADVVGALSAALNEGGDDARILLPLYNKPDYGRFGKKVASFTLSMPCGDQKIDIREKSTNGVIYYFVCHPWFCERKGIYGDTSFEPYADNVTRFMLLNLSALELPKAIGWQPDILHCHDWTTGLLPALASEHGRRNPKTIFTIHNLAYQGDFPRLDVLPSGVKVPAEGFTGKGTGRRLNMLRAGISYADAITTVSPTYAKEIMTERFGCGMEGILQRRADRVSGILNGIDTDEWNPSKDKHIAKKFSVSHMAGKAVVKAELQKELGLEVNPDKPLIAMISRLAEQKGFSELLFGEPCALERILSETDAQVAVVGTGDVRYEDILRNLDARFENLSAKITFDQALSHRMEAGADFFLMPSRYEPCGLNQMYSLAYGTLPIVGKTGGLADTVIDETVNPGEGNGILIEEVNANSIVDSVKRGVKLYYDRPCFKATQKRAMERDSSWGASAESYRALYKSLK